MLAQVALLLGNARNASASASLVGDFGDKKLKSFFRCAPEFAFPNHDHAPALRLQKRLLTGITLDVCVKFPLPSFDVACWCSGITTSRMSMPEASMHEDGNSVFRKYEIW